VSEVQAAPSLRERLNSPSETPFRHIPGLDGVRGIGIVIVMYGHYSAGLDESFGRRIFGVSLTIDLFFVLSGFLITSLLLEEWSRSQTVSMRNFYVRRGLRLFPALLVLLTVVAIIPIVTDWLPLKLTLAEVAAALLYVYPAILMVKGEQAFLFHLWTLSIEEWFYFAWPVLLTAVGLRPGRPRRLRAVVWGLVLFCAVVAVIRVTSGPDSSLAIVYALRPDSLAYGALLALFVRKLPDWSNPARERVLTVLTAIGCVGWLYFDMFAVYPGPASLSEGDFHNEAWTSWNYQLGIFCCVLVILHVVTRPGSPVTKALTFRPFVRIGALSYGLYLWHQPIFLLAKEHWYDANRSVMPGWAFAICVGLVAFLVAQLSWRLVEVPALRMKKRYETVRPA